MKSVTWKGGEKRKKAGITELSVNTEKKNCLLADSSQSYGVSNYESGGRKDYMPLTTI